MNDWGIGAGIEFMMKLCLVLLIVAVPLALWKVVDIVIWCVQHISIGIN